MRHNIRHSWFMVRQAHHAWLTMPAICAYICVALFTGCAHSGPSFLSHALEEDIQASRTLIHEGHYKQAADDLSVFLEMSPKHSEARFLRALAYQNLEQFSLATADYEKVILQNANTQNALKAHYNLAMIYAYKSGEPQKALSHFDNYLSLSLNDHDSQNTQSSQKTYEVAKIMCALDAPNTSTTDSLPSEILTIHQIQNNSEKKTALEDLIRKYPHSPLPHYLLGQLEISEEHTSQAQHHFEESLEIRRTCAPCQEALGALLIKNKKIEEGHIHQKKAQLFKSLQQENL